MLSIKGKVWSERGAYVGACVNGQEKGEDTEKKRIRQSSDQFPLTLPICNRGRLPVFSAAAVVGVMLDQPVNHKIQTMIHCKRLTAVVFLLMENIIGCC